MWLWRKNKGGATDRGGGYEIKRVILNGREYTRRANREGLITQGIRSTEQGPEGSEENGNQSTR